METEQQTQKQISSAPPEGADNGSKIFCGKFATVGELEKAYAGLQSEFTRKCQRNALLEQRLQQMSTAAAGQGEGAQARQDVQVQEPRAATGEQSADGVQALAPVRDDGAAVDPALRERIVREFLARLHSAKPPQTISVGGKINAIPPQRPSSIAEAGRMFKGMLEKGGKHKW